MAYDWLISAGDSIGFQAGGDISAGEWVKGNTGEEKIVQATSGSDAIGIAAMDVEDDKYVTVYTEGIVKTSVVASGADVLIGTPLEVASATSLTNGAGTSKVVAIALEYIADGETETIKVKIVNQFY